MTTVRETVSLDASPQEVWAVIGNFDSPHTWHPGIVSSETVHDGAARFRHLTLGDGSKLVERLDSHDDVARQYVYSIVDAGAMPIRNYQSTIAVGGDGDTAEVVWSSNFDVDGAPEADVQAAISGVYTGGFAALVERFGAL